MANKLYEEDDIRAIADAIRSKNGTTTQYTVADMANAVSNIPTGSGGTDTSDATAAASEILSPKTAYIASGKVTGTMADRSGTVQHTAGGADTQNSGLRFNIPNNGYYNTGNKIYRSNANVANDIGLTASKIVTGNTILGIAGTGGGGGTDTSDATLTTGAYLLSPYSAYGPTGKLNGSMANNGSTGGTISTKSGVITIPSGFTSGGSVSIAQAEADKITAGNIRAGVSILGTLGTYAGSGGGSMPSGVSAMATGSYTPTSNNSSTEITILHTLGTIPDQIVFWTEDINWVSSAGTYMLGVVAFISAPNGSSSTMTNRSYTIRGLSSSAPAVTNTTSYGVQILPTTTNFKISPSSSAQIKGGCAYKWMAIKYAS